MIKYFDFEKSIEDIDNKINDINNNPSNRNEDLIKKYEAKKDIFFKDIYKSLTAWQKVQVARHPNRPHTIEYIKNCFSNFVPLCGDKKFSEDEAIIGGLAKIDDISVMVIGTEKGSTMETRIKHNFGMAKPEGYRKFQRLLTLSEKFGFPVITFIDTAGAYPGKDAEERGQSESIASSISKSLQIKVPIISIIIGEGGSGGAIALATADRILMLENAIYSVISPEGCASILWRNIESVQQAAESLKLTAQNCYKLKIIDGIIEEMPGGAHRFSEDQFLLVKKIIIEKMNELSKYSRENLVKDRNKKFLEITSNYIP
tara:strand:- start:2694 stop:3641 length:948 start_codon:yes stop_codon:yes gene_type:complete